jgi:hypothetical protein
VRTNGVENIEFVRCVLNDSMNLGTWEWLLWSGIVNDYVIFWLCWVLDSEKWELRLCCWWCCDGVRNSLWMNEWLSWVEKTRDWGFCFCLLLGLRLMKVKLL